MNVLKYIHSFHFTNLSQCNQQDYHLLFIVLSFSNRSRPLAIHIRFLFFIRCFASIIQKTRHDIVTTSDVERCWSRFDPGKDFGNDFIIHSSGNKWTYLNIYIHFTLPTFSQCNQQDSRLLFIALSFSNNFRPLIVHTRFLFLTCYSTLKLQETRHDILVISKIWARISKHVFRSAIQKQCCPNYPQIFFNEQLDLRAAIDIDIAKGPVRK